MHRMLTLAALCMALTACDYRVPLTTRAQIPIDPAVLGLWETHLAHGTQRLLVLPLGADEYLLSFPAGTDAAMFARATPVELDGRTLIQIRWFGNAAGNVPDDDRVYQYGRYTLGADGLATELVDTDVVSKEIATSADLRAALRAHLDDPALFGDPRRFVRVAS